MSIDNSTLPSFGTIEINALALNIITEFAVDHPAMMVELSLSSLLFGVLTALSLTSIYLLVRRGSTVQKYVLVAATILLYMFTGMYMAALIWNWFSRSSLVSRASGGLFSSSYNGDQEIAAFGQVVRRQAWMLMYALGMNVIIGDAVVRWRVCVIWRNKYVLFVCDHAPNPLSDSPNVVGMVGAQVSQSVRDLKTGLVLLLLDNGYSAAASILSLATNVLATFLIAYKAWEHWRLVKEHFATAGTPSQVLQALTLLIESGSIYSIFLIFITIYQMYPDSSRAAPGQTFGRVGADIIFGCLVPFVAIYPAMIIVLVALKRSVIDNGGLSRVANVHGAGPAIDDTPISAIIFQPSESTFRTPAEASMEDSSRETLTNEYHIDSAQSLAC